jgi:hypothetical protein
MRTAGLNSDETLKAMVAEAVQQQTQIRAAVRGKPATTKPTTK